MRIVKRYIIGRGNQRQQGSNNMQRFKLHRSLVKGKPTGRKSSGGYILWALIASAFILMLFSGCASKSTSDSQNVPVSQPSQADQPGYVAVNKNEVFYMAWTQTGGQLVGQLQTARLKGYKVSSETHSFKGVVNSPNISISFTGGTWSDGLSGQTWTGILQDNLLSLKYPAKDGTIQTLVFKTGSSSDFNQAVKTLQEQGPQQASDKDSQENMKDTRSALDTALKNLNQNTAALAAVKYDKYIEAMTTDYNQMQQDYQKLLADAAVHPLTHFQLNTVKYDLNTNMKYDLNSNLHYSAKNNVGYEIQQINAFCNQTKNNISSLQECWQDYLLYNAPDTEFNETTVSTAVKAAQDQLVQVEKKTNSALLQGNDYYDKGVLLYQTAEEYVAGLKPTD